MPRSETPRLFLWRASQVQQPVRSSRPVWPKPLSPRHAQSASMWQASGTAKNRNRSYSARTTAAAGGRGNTVPAPTIKTYRRARSSSQAAPAIPSASRASTGRFSSPAKKAGQAHHAAALLPSKTCENRRRRWRQQIPQWHRRSARGPRKGRAVHPGSMRGARSGLSGAIGHSLQCALRRP